MASKENIKFKELEKRIQQLEQQVQPVIDMHSAASFKTGLVYNLLPKIEPLWLKVKPVFKFIYQYFYSLLFFCLLIFIITTSCIYDRTELASIAKDYMLSEQVRFMIISGMTSVIIIFARRYSFIVDIYKFLEASVTSFIVIYSFTLVIALIVHSLMIKFNIIDIQNIQETNITYILIAIFLATMFILTL